MRAVVQRVLSASVTVEGQTVSSIGPGLLVFLGVGKMETKEKMRWLAEKVAHLRIFEDDAGKMNGSLLDTTQAILVVSQFTLYADCQKGRRPSFVDACEPNEAQRWYLRFCEACRSLGLLVQEGVFRADMQVSLVNDGPVTLWLDTDR